MPEEITAVPETDVAKHIRENYVGDEQQIMNTELALKFAKIAKTMSDEGAFVSGLGQVEEWLRLIFLEASKKRVLFEPPNKDLADEDRKKGFNRLSRLLHCSANSFGWNTRKNIVLSGFSHGPDIVEIVRGKQMWKDMVGSNHGEFTHSIQWLVLQALLGKEEGYNLPDLYAASVDYSKHNTHDGIAEKSYKRVYLWDFLVDCLPWGGRTEKEDWNAATGVAPFSATPRSPAYANTVIFKQDGFLGKWLKGRYDAPQRQWVHPGDPDGSTTKVHGHIKHLSEIPAILRLPQGNSKSKTSPYQADALRQEHIVPQRQPFEGNKGYTGLQSTAPFHKWQAQKDKNTGEMTKEHNSTGFKFTRPDQVLKENSEFEKLARTILLG